MGIFNEEQVRMLEEKLNSSYVSKRKQSGVSLSYLEGYHVIDEANRIFGFDGWSYFVSDIKVVGEQDVKIGAQKKDGTEVGVIATVEVCVSNDEGSVTRQDVGFGSQRGTSHVSVYEMAYKEAVTDALKRALRSFGNQFGNALYDKTQKNVTEDSAKPVKGKSKSKKTSAKTKPKTSNEGGSKAPTQEKDFIKMIDDLKTEEEFLNFRTEYREEIKASSNSKQIVAHFNQKKKEV